MIFNQNSHRVDTLEIKAQIYRSIGQQRAEKYFDHLRRFFSSKISKSDFDRLCVRIIGRENIALNNRLIRSIIKNACTAKSPPPKNTFKRVTGYHRKIIHTPYGDVFPRSPNKVRSPVNKDRKLRDRPSPLGPLGKPQSLTTCDEVGSKGQSPVELISLGSRPPVEVGSVEDGEEVEQVAGSPGVQSKSPVTAPLGVFVNSRGSRKGVSSTHRFRNGYYSQSCSINGELPDTRTLRNCMASTLETEGIRFSTDCVNLLNNSLDAYLKRLIVPCVDLARSRLNSKLVPGTQRSKMPFSASVTDFSAAMELNPRILGEDWPLKLEKISLHASEE